MKVYPHEYSVWSVPADVRYDQKERAGCTDQYAERRERSEHRNGSSALQTGGVFFRAG